MRVDAARVEDLLLAGGEVGRQAGDAAHDLVGGRLVHAALDVGPGVDPDDVAGRREQERLAPSVISTQGV